MTEQAEPSASRQAAAPRLGDFTATPRVLLVAALAVPVGGLSAGVAWLLLRLIGLITNLVFYSRVATSLVAPDAHHHNPVLVVVAPVVGGLVIGLMARYGSEKIRGHGMPEALEAILTGGSKVQPRVAALKPVASAIAIGTGGPFGAEGPIIMTGGAFGSLIAQFVHLTADERKTLLVAGAAGGMAATFNTPFAAVMLAVELLLFEWRPRSYIPVATAVAVATAVRTVILGGGSLFRVPHVSLHVTPGIDALCVIAGVIAGLLAVVATVLVYASEDAFGRLRLHWMWWPAIGGLVIGIGGLFVPQALGVGYDVIGAELDGSIGLGLVAGILVVKTLIWSLSLGSGTSGGVLAPMFMVGGALGTLEAHVFPSVAPGFWPLVGLAGVLGGVMRSPLTGVVFAIELTGRLDAVLPLLIGASTAYAVSVLVLKRSVLTEKIARRGYHLTREYDVDPLEVLFVRDAMSGEFTSFPVGEDITAVLATFVDGRRQLRDRQHRQRLYPVLDEVGVMHGVLTRRDVLDQALRDEPSVRVVDDLMVRRPVIAHPDETLRTVAYRMAASGFARVPVLERGTGRAVGLLTLSQLLQGRLRDLREAREVEQVLRFRVVLPTRRHSRRGAARSG
ncbi:MAG TPA: chloride channel protein [Mycobacteriales bacterium]|nr:chloride channel protein [Mycobacteriales bacterium]